MKKEKTSQTEKRKGIMIVGATSGLGLEVARHFISEGWRVGVAGRNEERLEALRASAPQQVFPMMIDVTLPDTPDRLDRLAEAMGGTDIFLHTAGILKEDESLSYDLMRQTIDTNVLGMGFSLLWAYHYFAASDRKGRIAAISSIAGFRGLGDLPVYSATKAFDQTLTEALRQKAAAERLPIRIIDIRPGWTRTPLLSRNRKYIFEMPAEKALPEIIQAILHARRSATIGLRWKILCFFERILPACIWEKLHLPLWRNTR